MTERNIHIRQHRCGLSAAPIAYFDHFCCKFFRLFNGFHKCAAAHFYVKHDGMRASGYLFAHNA